MLANSTSFIYANVRTIPIAINIWNVGKKLSVRTACGTSFVIAAGTGARRNQANTISFSFLYDLIQGDIITQYIPNKRNGNSDNDHYFDEELYEERYAIERTNTWMDSFRTLLNRFDTTVTSWKGFNYLAFIIIALKKFYKQKKFR